MGIWVSRFASHPFLWSTHPSPSLQGIYTSFLICIHSTMSLNHCCICDMRISKVPTPLQCLHQTISILLDPKGAGVKELYSNSPSRLIFFVPSPRHPPFLLFSSSSISVWNTWSWVIFRVSRGVNELGGLHSCRSSLRSAQFPLGPTHLTDKK